MSTTSLRSFPVELIASIADKLDSDADFSAFSRTSRRLHRILDTRLYARDASHDHEALCWSIENALCSLLTKTIEHGADVNSRNKWPDLTTPLTFAARMGHVEILKLLLKHGADPNPADWKEMRETPLVRAAREGHYEVAKILIDAGADIHVTGINGEWGPLALVAAAGSGQNDDLVRLLLDKGVLSGRPEEHGGTYALQMAIAYQRLSTVKLLVEAGADPSVGDDDGFTPLILALEAGSEEIAFCLLGNEADLEQSDNDGRGLMWFAVKNGRDNIVRYLLDRGCRAHRDEWTPFIAAVEAGNTELAELLLDAGALIEHEDDMGSTPLRIALRRGQQEMVDLLVKKGASMEAATKASPPPHWWSMAS